jgi:hypothetical protein
MEHVPGKLDQRARPERSSATSESPEPVSDQSFLGLLALQRRIGNLGTERLIRRLAAEQTGLIQRVPHVVTPDAASKTFFAGTYGPTDMVPGAAGDGGFQATYLPKQSLLKVVMKVAVVFKDSIDFSSGTGVADPAAPNLTAVAAVANNPATPAAQRLAIRRAHQWAAKEKTPWIAQLKDLIQSQWSGQFEFHVNRPNWEWIGAKVKVQLVTHAGARAAGDHLEVNALKFPANENLYTHGGFSVTGAAPTNAAGAYTTPGSTSAFDQSMTLASTDIKPRIDGNVLRQQIFFGNTPATRDTLDATAQGRITNIIATFNGAGGSPATATTAAVPPTPGHRDCKVELVAHASQVGSDAANRAMAARRAAAVRAALVSGGFTNIATRVHATNVGSAGAHGGDDARDRRVDVVVDSGTAQVLAVHEFGHALGLGDEYANTPLFGSPSGLSVGQATAHNPQVQNMQDDSGAKLPGAIGEVNDNIMSGGNKIRPQHYATFHNALVQLTTEPNWALGPKYPHK